MRIEFIFVSFTRLKKRRIRDRKEYLCFINIIKCSLIHLFAHTRLNLIYKLLDRCEQIDRICKQFACDGSLYIFTSFEKCKKITIRPVSSLLHRSYRGVHGLRKLSKSETTVPGWFKWEPHDDRTPVQLFFVLRLHHGSTNSYGMPSWSSIRRSASNLRL